MESPQNTPHLTDADIRHFSVDFVKALQVLCPNPNMFLGNINSSLNIPFGITLNALPEVDKEDVIPLLKERKAQLAQQIKNLLSQAVQLPTISLIGLNRSAEWDDIQVEFSPKEVEGKRVFFFLLMKIAIEGLQGLAIQPGSSWKNHEDLS